MEVVLEPDATPLVRIIATMLSASLTEAGLARRAAGLRGVFALRSEKDPQAVTMRFDRGRVALTRGVAADAQVVATVDLDNMSGPDASKPKVRGAARHPRFALAVSKLLEPSARTWSEHARAFWLFAQARPAMPERIRVVCLDDGEELELGNGSEASSTYEIHGSALALVSIFSGNSVFGQDLLDGKVYAIGSFQHASVLTGSFLEWMMRACP
ncbi:MAG TPA: hypothetical protein VIK54_17860 [Acidimicrobiia bacterium]